jgi:hypothetical protein
MVVPVIGKPVSHGCHRRTRSTQVRSCGYSGRQSVALDVSL